MLVFAFNYSRLQMEFVFNLITKLNVTLMSSGPHAQARNIQIQYLQNRRMSHSFLFSTTHKNMSAKAALEDKVSVSAKTRRRST